MQKQLVNNVKMQSEKTLTARIYFFQTKQQTEKFHKETK